MKRIKFGKIRQIRMQIKKIYSVIITNFVEYRYIRLNNIKSITCKKTHSYSKLPHHQIQNFLQCTFTIFCQNCKWSIDISYFFVTVWVEYLWEIKDMYDKYIVSYAISWIKNLQLLLNIVQKTLNIITYEPINDITFRWRNPFYKYDYQKLLANDNIIRSIST